MRTSTTLTTAGRSSLRRVLSRVLCGVVALVGSGLALAVTAPEPSHAAPAGCAGSGHFVFTATATNTTGYIAYIPSSYGLYSWNPLFVTQLLTSALDPHPLGVWFDPYSQHWTIFNEDSTDIPLGTSFAVNTWCEPVSTTLTATASNVSGDSMLIDDPTTNGNPNAVVYATQVWTGTTNAHEIGVFYNVGAAKWAIFNLDFAPMPVGASFDVMLGSSATLIVTASASNTVADLVYVIDARFNNQPAVIPLLAQLS